MTLPHTQGSHRNTLRSSNTAANGRMQRKREKSNFTHFLSPRKPPPSQSSEPPSRAPLCCPAPRPLPHHVKYLGRGCVCVCVCYGACFFPSLSPPSSLSLEAMRLHAPPGGTALSPRAWWTPLVREWLSEMRTYSPPSPAMRLLANGQTRIISSDLFSHRTPQEDSVFLTKAKINGFLFFFFFPAADPPLFM